jgi:hypothetical protein
LSNDFFAQLRVRVSGAIAWGRGRLRRRMDRSWQKFNARMRAPGLVACRWMLRRQGRPHGLPGELIVSLTSYPPRFRTLDLTLRCLLTQTVRPDRVMLWIAEADMAKLPPAVVALAEYGLDIRACKDTRSYKKIIPALAAFPSAYIATADDDVYYAAQWLGQLVELAGERIVVCHRAHDVRLDDAGRMPPYLTWEPAGSGPAGTLFPTGVGGILYGPSSLSPEVLDEELFTRLCPHGDDIWLWWMGRRAGSEYRKTRAQWKELWWAGVKQGLFRANVLGGGNDEQITNMVAHFGIPGSVGS